MKKFALGFCTALLITLTISAHAEIKEFILHQADYKVIVDGKEYNDPKLPTLTYNGTTYVPMKNLADLLGVSVNWNNELYQAEISKIISTEVEVNHQTNKRNLTTADGLKIVLHDSTEYVPVKDIEDKYHSIAFKFNIDNNTCKLVTYSSKEPLCDKKIPITVIQNKSHITVDDYSKYLIEYLNY